MAGMVAILNLAKASEAGAPDVAEKLGKVSPTAVSVLSAWGGGGAAKLAAVAAVPPPRKKPPPPVPQDLAANVPGQSPRIVRGAKLANKPPQCSSAVRPLVSSNGTALLRGTALNGGAKKKKKRRKKKKKKKTDQQSKNTSNANIPALDCHFLPTDCL